MTRILFAALIFAAAPAVAQTEPAVSRMIAETGLTRTEAVLAAVAAPTPTDRFALAGVRFLRAIERTLQQRWRMGINTERTELPVLRLPVARNPSPEPFDAQAIEDLFAGLVADMDAARAPLAGITDADQIDLPIAIGDVWLDVNMNGNRDDGEGLAQIADLLLTGGRTVETDLPVVRFDVADAAWLSAYTHFLSGFAELFLAFEPRRQIDRVLEASRQMNALAADTPYRNALDMQFGMQINRIAMIYFSLGQQPDPAHTRAARAHLLAMIADNRRLWARVAAETDNVGEWLPGDGQDQALGIEVPDGTGARWLAVLGDAEALLKGTKLIPHWRYRQGAGINLWKLLQDPVPVDLPAWIHGIGLLPFAEKGDVVSADTWRDFERLLSGDATMFAIYLN